MKDRQMALRMTARISRLPLVLGLALGFALHAAAVSATIINFDNLGSLGCTASTPATSGVPNGYEGLNWSTDSGGFPVDAVALQCDANYQGPIYKNTYGSPSGEFAAYNSQGFGEMRITPVSGTFDFFGAQFSSFVFDNGVKGYDPFSAYSVQLVGYQGGVPTFFATLDLYSDNGTIINAVTSYSAAFGGPWPGLDRLSFFAGDGIIANSPTFGLDGRSFLVDNLEVTLNVPEPGTALLLLAGLVAMARNPKRRRA
jgi:hypothetical protein